MVNTHSNYEDVDISRENHVVPNVLKKYQANKSALNNQSPIDDDVMNWLLQQDDETRNHINEVIRHLMAIKHV